MLGCGLTLSFFFVFQVICIIWSTKSIYRSSCKEPGKISTVTLLTSQTFLIIKCKCIKYDAHYCNFIFFFSFLLFCLLHRVQVVTNCQNTVQGFKQFHGRAFSDPYVQSAKSNLVYDLAQMPSGSTGIKVRWRILRYVFDITQVTLSTGGEEEAIGAVRRTRAIKNKRDSHKKVNREKA